MHAVIAVVVALVVGGILGYAFRGAENRLLHEGEAEVEQLAGDVKKHL